MSLYIGGNSNGFDVDNALVGTANGIGVAEEIYIGDKFSEPQLIYSRVDVERDILKENPYNLLRSGKLNENYIGRTIYLSNSETSCREWIIIGYSHDNDDRSIDLISKHAIADSMLLSNSNMDTTATKWVPGAFVEGFTDDIAKLLCPIEVETKGNYKYAYAKIPSAIELGVSDANTESSGKIYPYFGTGLVGTNSKAILKDSSNNPIVYWTRYEFTEYVNKNSIQYGVCIDTTGKACKRNIDFNSASAEHAAVRTIIRIIPKIRMKDSVDKLLATVNPADLLTSGRLSANDIGKTVYLSNGSISSQEWVIADVNHDDTNATVDLITKYTTGNTSSDSEYCDYYESNMRYSLADIVSGFIPSIFKVLAPFSIMSGPYELKDLIKIPSAAELGLQPPINSADEGSIYPLFGNELHTTNPSAIRLNSSSELVNYWTRTASSPNNVIVDTNGTAIAVEGHADEEDNLYVIRFKKPNKYESKDELFMHVNSIGLFKKGVLDRSDIGKTVLLSNSEISDRCYSEWIIADLNHDGTENTVDLIIADVTSASQDLVQSEYPESFIREDLNNRVFNAFDIGIRRLLVNCGCYFDGMDLGDKVKIPSYEELGMPTDGCNDCGGTRYPIFNYVDGAEVNESCIGRDHMKYADLYHVRNKYIDDDSAHPGVDDCGNPIDTDFYGIAVMACIRVQCYD